MAPASESKGVTEWKRTRAVILPAFNSSKVHISVVQIILKSAIMTLGQSLEPIQSLQKTSH